MAGSSDGNAQKAFIYLCGTLEANGVRGSERSEVGPRAGVVDALVRYQEFS